MKASFLLTTQRQNCNLRNGRVLGLQDPKKHYAKKQIEDDAHIFLLLSSLNLLKVNAANSYSGGVIISGLHVLIKIPPDVKQSLQRISLHTQLFPGTAVAQWLRCCATNRKVAGLIPAGVSGFFIDIKSFRSHCGPEVDSASNRNEYQEHFLGVKATGA